MMMAMSIHVQWRDHGGTVIIDYYRRERLDFDNQQWLGSAWRYVGFDWFSAGRQWLGWCDGFVGLLGTGGCTLIGFTGCSTRTVVLGDNGCVRQWYNSRRWWSVRELPGKTVECPFLAVQKDRPAHSVYRVDNCM